MIGLDRLLDRPGVIAAGQFSPEGKMVRGVGKLDKEQFRDCMNLLLAGRLG